MNELIIDEFSILIDYFQLPKEQIKVIDNRIKPTKDSIKDRTSYTDKIKSIEDRAIKKKMFIYIK